MEAAICSVRSNISENTKFYGGRLQANPESDCHESYKSYIFSKLCQRFMEPQRINTVLTGIRC
jgi:hypothetical protein